GGRSSGGGDGRRGGGVAGAGSDAGRSRRAGGRRLVCSAVGAAGRSRIGTADGPQARRYRALTPARPSAPAVSRVWDPVLLAALATDGLGGQRSTTSCTHVFRVGRAAAARQLQDLGLAPVVLGRDQVDVLEHRAAEESQLLETQLAGVDIEQDVRATLGA